MPIYTGTSGFAYTAWKGRFYPPETKDRDFLRYYASKLRVVEINNTFYRMPRRSMLEKWASEVPEEFLFVVKAPQRISHIQRLGPDAQDSVRYLVEQLEGLGQHLGPVLVQTPNSVRCDVERLEAFLAMFPAGVRVALEFRHESWFDAAVLDCLSRHRAALVTMDSEAAKPPVTSIPGATSESRWAHLAAQVRATTDFGYLRLRQPAYTDEELTAWLEAIDAQPWADTYVFFKHEDDGTGPALASRLEERARVSRR